MPNGREEHQGATVASGVGMAERKAPELAIVDADLWQRVGSM
jgi:hypothetical protein